MWCWWILKTQCCWYCQQVRQGSWGLNRGGVGSFGVGEGWRRIQGFRCIAGIGRGNLWWFGRWVRRWVLGSWGRGRSGRFCLLCSLKGKLSSRTYLLPWSVGFRMKHCCMCRLGGCRNLLGICCRIGMNWQEDSSQKGSSARACMNSLQQRDSRKGNWCRYRHQCSWSMGRSSYCRLHSKSTSQQGMKICTVPIAAPKNCYRWGNSFHHYR